MRLSLALPFSAFAFCRRLQPVSRLPPNPSFKRTRQKRRAAELQVVRRPAIRIAFAPIAAAPIGVCASPSCSPPPSLPTALGPLPSRKRMRCQTRRAFVAPLSPPVSSLPVRREPSVVIPAGSPCARVVPPVRLSRKRPRRASPGEAAPRRQRNAGGCRSGIHRLPRRRLLRACGVS